jgi:ribonuclease Y
MSDVLINILVAVGCFGVGIGFTRLILKWVSVKNIPEEEIEKAANKIISDKIEAADKEVEEIRKRSENRLLQMRKEVEEHEELLIQREKKLNKRTREIDQKNEEFDKDVDNLKKMQAGIEKTRIRLKEELEKISGLTREEAQKKLKEEIEEDMKDYTAKKIRQAEVMAEESADEKVKHILIDSMQRVATDYVGETTTASIKVDDEKVKGRIIGKEGRNIRAFEKITGVDVIVDESPNTIALSSFDPLRREIAKVAMETLIKDGRIHPGSIEDAIRKAKNEISQEIKKNGQILAEEAGWPGIDMGLLKLIGKMKYRSSYGQSLMSHTIEVIRLGEVLAAETGADVDLVKKACLLHDVGKVLSHKIDSPHHHISGQIARKYDLDDKLVNAIEAHHLDIEPQSVEAVLVYIADAISGARPGARKDSYEQYIQRIEGIENAAKEVGGDKIDEVFAIRAGRELRVIVKPTLVSDDEAKVMAKKVAEEIQKTQSYPGNVEVMVIRETRAIEVAK